MSSDALYNTLKVQRAMRNLTQADLAVMAGVTRKSVNAIETGRMVPSVLLALKLARVLSVSVEALFSLERDQAVLRTQRHEAGLLGIVEDRHGERATDVDIETLPAPGCILRREAGNAVARAADDPAAIANGLERVKAALERVDMF